MDSVPLVVSATTVPVPVNPRSALPLPPVFVRCIRQYVSRNRSHDRYDTNTEGKNLKSELSEQDLQFCFLPFI